MHENCVEVDRDALEGASLVMAGVQSTLSILREALWNSGSHIETDVRNVCWLLECVMEEHIHMLDTAAAGEPTDRTAGEAASEEASGQRKWSLAEQRGEKRQADVAKEAGSIVILDDNFKETQRGCGKANCQGAGL